MTEMQILIAQLMVHLVAAGHHPTAAYQLADQIVSEAKNYRY